MSKSPFTVNKVVAVLIVLLLSFSVSKGQLADTLKEVKIRGRKKMQVSNDERINVYSPGQKIVSFDSITLKQYQFQSVANLLAQQSPVFIKTYGINGLATLSFRGASAAQSQVYWNGVPLQNAAMGVSDVSLLPVSLMNKVNLVYGSSSAMWGSGNVGGALVVENEKPYFDTTNIFHHSVYAVAGSFSQYQLGLRTGFSTGKWYVAVNGFGQSAKNNFNYTDGGLTRKMSNASLSSGVGLVQVAYKADSKNIVSLTGWYQQYYREVPRALFEAQSVKNQRDESLRLLADWGRNGKTVQSSLKVSYIKDHMQYRDTLALLNTKNASNQLYAEVAARFAVGMHHRIMIMTPVSVQWVDSAGISKTNTQNRYALAANYLYTDLNSKLRIALNLRGETVDNNSYLLPGGNLAYDIANWLTIKGNAQKTYRVPTINELYYNPGGNRNLQPESGWSTDAGYVFHSRSANRAVLSHGLSAFNRVIDNWIVWFGGAIWTPHNIATVHSRGVETDNKLTVGLGKLNLHVALNTSYVLSTTISSYISGDGSIGKQIPYAPRYNGQVNIGFNIKQLYFNYNHTYTGYRFITIDESQWLMPYNTGNVQILYTLPAGGNNLQFTAQCNNVWNKRYQVVNGRPMPGINLLLGIRFDVDY